MWPGSIVLSLTLMLSKSSRFVIFHDWYGDEMYARATTLYAHSPGNRLMGRLCIYPLPQKSEQSVYRFDVQTVLT